jgi:hypothetical protein
VIFTTGVCSGGCSFMISALIPRVIMDAKFRSCTPKQDGHRRHWRSCRVHFGRETRGLKRGLNKYQITCSAAWSLPGVILGAGLYGLQNLALADRLPLTGATIVALPMKIKGGEWCARSHYCSATVARPPDRHSLLRPVIMQFHFETTCHQNQKAKNHKK